MDPPLDLETRRLLISATLTARARRYLDGRVAPDAHADDLIALASKLSAEAGAVGSTLGLRFEPSYPGVTAGPQRTGEGLRLLLGCIAHDMQGNPIGVVFTAIIAGRLPQISVAPAVALIPAQWRPPEDFR
jgi:hypothetical protein